MIKKQNFGVEIEMNNMPRSKAQQIVAKVLGSTNTGSECSYDNHYVIDSKGRMWKCESDASISGGSGQATELVTPVLEYGDIETLQEVIRALRKAGAKTDSSCGIHIHVDGANHTPDSLKRLVNFMIARQDLIYESLEIGSRGNRWCKRLSKDLFAAMKKNRNLDNSSLEMIWYSNVNDGYCGGIDHRHYNETRYHGINLHAFFTKGTIEFRLFNSTLHAGKVKAYIQFCLAVSGWAISSQDRVVFRSMDGYTPDQKVTIMRNILTNRLGLWGGEFKTCRLHLMNPLKKAAGMNVREQAAA
ncbi:MAG: amidoligase family protein [Lachnospiraceae bacterium]|nr:amidoligase family protein [Lachnospiraceae bacterium]